jgi:hypothetical protein
MSYDDVRRGVSQYEYNEIAIGYFGITSMVIGWSLYKLTDMWAVGVIYLFVTILIMQTSFAKYLSAIYALIWTYFIGAFTFESQGIIAALIIGAFVLVIAYNLGLGTEEYYNDVNYYDDSYEYEDDNSYINQDYLFYDDLSEIKIALDNGHDINTRDNDGMTPLMYHIWMGRTRIAKYLYFEGASTQIKDKKGRTALDIAKVEKNKSMIKLLS